MKSYQSRGFTLIELVVVITILAILAAFAIPKFISLSTQARVATVNALAGTARSGAALARSMAMASGAALTAAQFAAHAQVYQAQATYDATVANYRQTVLTAFQQVEDNLAALRILAQEAEVEAVAVKAAEQSLTISTDQYKGGIVSYLTVITAQTAALQDERSAIDILTRRMTASVLLVEALGGGWDTSQLPTAADVIAASKRQH